MYNAKEFYTGGICELKNHTPVACDTKRQKPRIFSREVFCVKKMIIRVYGEYFYKPSQLTLLRFWKMLRGLKEICAIDDLDHVRSISFRNAFGVVNL